MRKYRPLKKAKEGESVRFGSGLSISSGQSSSGYATPDVLGGNMFTNPLTPSTNYFSKSSGGTTPRTGDPSKAEELGVMMGSAERPELLLRQESDRTRDRIARRTYRAMKKGQTYDASQDLSMKGRRDQRKADRLQKRIDKTTDAMLEAGQEAAQLQGAREGQNRLRREAADAEYEYDKAQANAFKNKMAAMDYAGDPSMMADMTDDAELPTRRQVTDDEASKEEIKAFKRTEKLDKKRDKLLDKQSKVPTPQSMQTKLDEAYRKEDAKELMRKKQGRYGWPYTEDTNLLPEHEEALRQQRAGQNIRGTYSYGTYTPTGVIKRDLYDQPTPTQPSGTGTGLSVADQLAMGVKPEDIVDPTTGEKAVRAIKRAYGGKIKKKGYRAIR